MVPREKRKQLLDEQGFLLLPGFTSPTELDELDQRIKQLLEQEGDRAGSEFKQEPYSRRLSNLINKGEIFRRLAGQPAILDLVQLVLGEHYKLSSMNARSANPRQPGGQPLHADMAAIADDQGAWVCNIIWLVNDFTPNNGCLRLVPGSHQWRTLPQDSMEDPLHLHPEEIHLTAQRGALIVLNAHVWHAGTANQTDHPRTALHGFYCRRDKPQQQYQKELVDPELQRQLPPALRQLLAVDDPHNDVLANQQTRRSGFLD
ncbi:MAG: phytanoyl-CoA dioxygenase family protein [Pirellulaceae bacterium]|nr:phytanoyl-CoA dioxygenase family protein [Pirellulaceae bacterium]